MPEKFPQNNHQTEQDQRWSAIESNEQDISSKLDTPFLQKYHDYIQLNDDGELAPIEIAGISQDDYKYLVLDMHIDTLPTDQALECIEHNRSAISHNMQTLEEANNLINEYSRISSSDREFLLNSSEITGKEKAYIFLIETARKAAEIDFGQLSSSPDMPVTFNQQEFMYNFKAQIEGIYALESVYAQHLLELSNAHFNILPQEGPNTPSPNSLEDAASCALESFIMHPNYKAEQILEYEDFLRGLELDCTHKKLIGNDAYGNPQFSEEVDVEEFRSRVLESIGENVMYKGRLPSKDEREQIYQQAEAKQIDYIAGRYFMTDDEAKGLAEYIDLDKPVALFRERSFSEDQEQERTKYSADFLKKANNRISKTETTIFHANKALAKAETALLASKIDYTGIKEINENKDLSIDDKLVQITFIIQSALGIKNLDRPDRPQPIKTGWLRTKMPSFLSKILKLDGDNMKDARLSCAGYYSHSEKTFYIKKPMFGRQKFNLEEMDTIAHELFHAYQHEIRKEVDFVEQSKDTHIAYSPTTNKKARDYDKNFSAYIQPGILFASPYYAQLVEVEARAFGAHVREGLRHRSIGHTALSKTNFA